MFARKGAGDYGGAEVFDWQKRLSSRAKHGERRIPPIDRRHVEAFSRFLNSLESLAGWEILNLCVIVLYYGFVFGFFLAMRFVEPKSAKAHKWKERVRALSWFIAGGSAMAAVMMIIRR